LWRSSDDELCATQTRRASGHSLGTGNWSAQVLRPVRCLEVCAMPRGRLSGAVRHGLTANFFSPASVHPEFFTACPEVAYYKHCGSAEGCHLKGCSCSGHCQAAVMTRTLLLWATMGEVTLSVAPVRLVNRCNAAGLSG
jgi:hypothetical protein